MTLHPHKTTLPPEVEEVFKPLRNEISFLHGNWEVYQQLFDHPKIAEVAKLAPGGFVLIQLVFRHEIVMGFSRVTDPKTTGKKENLTLQQLLHVFKKHCTDSALVARLKDDEKVILKECESFRTIRNRSLAHLDLNTFLRTHPEPLPTLDGEQVKKCLKLLGEFMNDILGHFTSIHFDFVPHLSPAPRNIVYGLHKFLEWQPIIDEIERKKHLSE